MKPIATYRLQLGRTGGPDLHRARQLLPWLRDLGVSHLYLSPVLQSRASSTHGYDVCDPRRVDEALGGWAAMIALGEEARRLAMGVLLDVVPNHMAVTADNPLLADVLAHGRASAFAPVFDIAWTTRRGQPHRIVLPILGAPLREVLANGEITLGLSDGFEARYYDHRAPLDPATVAPLLAAMARQTSDGPARQLVEAARQLRRLPPRTPEARGERAERAAEAMRAVLEVHQAEPRLAEAALAELGRDEVRRLLERQAWRLSFWRRGRFRLNYRRFFDINDLVALRQEDPDVFALTHAATLQLVKEGAVTDLRIDHIDGIREPERYLRRLRERIGDDALLLVEKILAPDERLPERWPCDGETGYAFLNDLEAALIDPRGAERIEADWAGFTGIRLSFHDHAVAAKRRVLREPLKPDVTQVARAMRPFVGDLERHPVEAAIIAVAAALDVYRTYVTPDGALSDVDRARLIAACEHAEASGIAPPEALAAVRRILLLRGVDEVDEARRAQWLAAVARFQQLTGPAAAKGVEDTALYIHVPLLSRNEVGGEPGPPDHDPVGTLHERSAARPPRGLLAVSTHDTKRSADVRARLDVLSEIPDEWEAAVRRWFRWLRPARTQTRGRWQPDRNTAYLMLQTLVGVWPLETDPDLGALAGRVVAYMIKAAREAKVQTRWVRPDPGFEKATTAYVEAALDPERSRRLIEDLARFAGRIARPGLYNALGRTLIHLTSRGIPDLYQAEPDWSFALVDPDNRRPVDFDALAERTRALAEAWQRPEGRLDQVRGMLEHIEDGRLKLHVIQRALAARGAAPERFTAGDYVPLRAEGEHASHVIAFARRDDSGTTISVATRLPLTLAGSEHPTGAVWGDTALLLPERAAWRDHLTGRVHEPTDRLPLRDALASLPVALLEAQ